MVTFMHNGNSDVSSGANFLYVSPEDDGSFTIDAPGHSSANKLHKFVPIDILDTNRTTQFEIPAALEMSAGTLIERKGILVTSYGNLSVYAFNENQAANSQDAYNAIPIEALGKFYYVPTVRNNPAFTVTAVQDNTTVNITLKTKCSVDWEQKTYTNGGIITVRLDIFEVFQLSLKGACDLGGTTVSSDHPVSVTSGSSCATLKSGQTCSHVVEQLLPNELWGRRFIVPSLDDINESKIRMISSKESRFTVVTEHHKDGTSHTRTHPIAGDQAIDMVVPPGTVTEIFNSEKLHVTKIGLGNSSYIISIPHVDGYGWNYTVTPLNNQYGNNYTNYLSILAYTDALDSLTINGVHPEYHHWRSVVDLGYSHGIFLMSNGTSYQIEASHPFMAQAFGHSSHGAYAFNAGSRFDHLPSGGYMIRPDQIPTTSKPHTAASPNPTFSPSTTSLSPTSTSSASSPSIISQTSTSASITGCKDDVPNCQEVDNTLNICKEPVAAYKYCRKFCKLCDSPGIIG
ncbi:hypothetical protein LOTGIDRAFT_171813 [Lottia gigantea]|uniref:IgGFc-binding protein N-terminal domain-containing protein n=1 Tax=Lottia gigantea TaxID=225164 RepID=V4AYE5_LOTGI|nr:hypothetical protein LOTGIDRAFT_171813 [Lottia gigantea]ESP02613.1 hypothetical protein LOTGIDRAFT_171813 [Lottia gigantea]